MLYFHEIKDGVKVLRVAEYEDAISAVNHQKYLKKEFHKLDMKVHGAVLALVK